MTSHAHVERPGHGDYHEHAHGTHEHAHVSSLKSLFMTFGALLVLTVVTVWVSRGPIDFGWLSLFIALVVASMKAMLVMLFFMHLIHDRRFNMVAFFTGYLFLALFLFFALLDSGQYQDEIKSYQLANPSSNPALVAPGPLAPTPEDARSPTSQHTEGDVKGGAK